MVVHGQFKQKLASQPGEFWGVLVGSRIHTRIVEFGITVCQHVAKADDDAKLGNAGRNHGVMSIQPLQCLASDFQCPLDSKAHHAVIAVLLQRNAGHEVAGRLCMLLDIFEQNRSVTRLHG